MATYPRVEELVTEAVRLAEEMERLDVSLRLLGGTAVFLHCPGATGGEPHRPIDDIDCAIPGSDADRLRGALLPAGYTAASEHLNALRGDQRLIFDGPVGRLDVFIETFEMCHRIALGKRLHLDFPTLTVTDLLLTKLQIVELNAKDLDDIELLLKEHDVGTEEEDMINVTYLGHLVRDDWGLWRTATGTLRDVATRKPNVASKAASVCDALQRVQKSRRFRLRAMVGERKRWYDLPDDPSL